MKPFLFVVYQEEQKKGRRVLVDARLWRMPESDLEGEVRRVWAETVRRVADGRADGLPRESQSVIFHVRPHGRNNRDTLPTPKNGDLVKKSFWLNRKYIGSTLHRD